MDMIGVNSADVSLRRIIPISALGVGLSFLGMREDHRRSYGLKM